MSSLPTKDNKRDRIIVLYKEGKDERNSKRCLSVFFNNR
ncbi:hypothetical protein BH23THE1_BH23THE1_25810 [soil metagenome]